jgi:hypothetical protein
MDILINELSLNGQFVTAEDFVNDALPPLIVLLNEIDFNKDSLYKKYDFYSSLVTETYSIYDILTGSISRQYDEIRKFKSQIDRLFDDPYWENSRKHPEDSKYVHNGHNICGQSLAEACERDKIVVSFLHSGFSSIQLSVLKEKTEMKIDNLFQKGHYTDMAWERNMMSCEDYCVRTFAGTKIDFSEIDAKEGFSLLKREDEHLFIDGFRKFTGLSWIQIRVDDALDYKEYTDSNGHFKRLNKRIYKFRISQKYRCFGYVEQGIFYVLSFDLTHKLSD